MGCGTSASSTGSEPTYSSTSTKKSRETAYKVSRPVKKPATKPKKEPFVPETFGTPPLPHLQKTVSANLTPEEIQERRLKIAESAEARRAKEAKRGLTKSGEIDMKILQKRSADLAAYEKENPRGMEDFALRYKK